MRLVTMGYRPVEADCGEVENRCRAAEDVEGNPRVAQNVSETPPSVVHLQRNPIVITST